MTWELQSDEVLVERVRAGDTEAADLLYRRHRDRVLAICRRHAPHDRAEEAAQETFITVIAAIRRGTAQPVRFDAYLSRAAHNTAVSAGRAATRRVVPVGALDDAALGQTADPSDAVVVQTMVEEGLGALPDTQRALLRSHYLDDCPLADIAAARGTTPGTVKVQLHRARVSMRRWADERGIVLLPAPLVRWLREHAPQLPGVEAAVSAIVAAALLTVGALGSRPAPVMDPSDASQVVTATGSGVAREAAVGAGPAGSAAGLPGTPSTAAGVVQVGAGAEATAGRQPPRPPRGLQDFAPEFDPIPVPLTDGEISRERSGPHPTVVGVYVVQTPESTGGYIVDVGFTSDDEEAETAVAPVCDPLDAAPRAYCTTADR